MDDEQVSFHIAETHTCAQFPHKVWKQKSARYTYNCINDHSNKNKNVDDLAACVWCIS